MLANIGVHLKFHWPSTQAYATFVLQRDDRALWNILQGKVDPSTINTPGLFLPHLPVAYASYGQVGIQICEKCGPDFGTWSEMASPFLGREIVRLYSMMMLIRYAMVVLGVRCGSD